MQQWLDEAPSNIALIKYMGKKDSEVNLADNPSLSYTLNNLISRVSLQLSNNDCDTWQPLIAENMTEISLPDAAKTRFLNHLARVKDKFNINQSFLVQSNNNFPHSSGIASSASSFAALTKCAIKAACDLTNKSLPSAMIQANISRMGSGSSCRSFFSPWALWNGEEVSSIDLPYKELKNEVIIINRASKEISSSLAHKLILTSPNYKDRNKRAQNNLDTLLQAFKSQNWHDMYHICWNEFQDMHNLFSSCDKPFTYITDTSNKVLKQLQDFWKSEQDGPIVTMDAGPNIHLLYRPDQVEMAAEFRKKFLIGNFDVL
ncbi:MAG: diphosphomevalonate decarboxylase [Legionellaceae bacterium]|nr:diphosphomevalonate decarboxylase [Legionellaceae bacterium]